MAYTLHVDRGVPRIVAAAAAADPPNDPDVVALPGDAVTAEQVQRHNAQATAMEQAIVPLRASELVMLRDLAVAMRSLPWYVGPTDSLDAVCAFVKARFRAADARHRAVRRAYNAYHVAGSRRVYECTPDDTGLFPSHDVVSWATVRRRIQERRRIRRSVDDRATVRVFRDADATVARLYRRGADAIVINPQEWDTAPGPPSVPPNDTLAAYYDHNVLQPIERTAVGSHLGSIVHQRLLVRWAAEDGAIDAGDNYANIGAVGTDPDAAIHARFRYRDAVRGRGLARVASPGKVYPPEGGPPVDAADDDDAAYRAVAGHGNNGYRVVVSGAFQPVFNETTGGAQRRTLLPCLVLKHLRDASLEYKTANPDHLLVVQMERAIAAALARERLAVVAAEPWVYDASRLLYTSEKPDGSFGVEFFWTRADFVAVDQDTGHVVVGELKNRFGATTQYDALKDAADVQQVFVNAWLVSLIYRVRVDEVCLVYANRSMDVVVVRHPFAGSIRHNPFVRSSLSAFLELSAIFVDRHGVVENFHEITDATERGQFLPWRFFEVEGQSMVDEAPAVPLVVGGGFVLHEWYCRQHGWINVRRAFRAGRGGLVANFETGPPPWQDRPAAAAAAVGAPPVAPLVRIGAAAAAAAAASPFTFHGGLDPFTAGRTSRVYPRTEPQYQRFLRTTMLVQNVARVAGRMAHLIACTCAPLRVAHVVLGSRCDGDDAGDDDAGDAGAPHDVGDRVDQCERCRRWTRRYPPQGVAACSGGRHGPCNEAQAHAGAWKARRAVLIRALHRHVNRRVVDQYQLHGAPYARFVAVSQRPFWSEQCKRVVAARAGLGSAVDAVLGAIERDETVPLRGGRWRRRLRRHARRGAVVRWIMGEEEGNTR